MKVPNWKSLLKADPTEWLLEENNPSVRYFALRDLLNKSENNKDVIAAKKAIMKTGVVPKILAKQEEGGYWRKPENFYERDKGKYKGTVWTFMILAEHGADGMDKRIKSTRDFILDWSQDRKTGGFAYRGTKKNGGRPSGVIPCLTGNMVWSMIRLGYLNDPRVKKGIKWITTYQRFDDGKMEKPVDWPYDLFKSCYGKHTCHMGVVKTLKALVEIPVNKRIKAVKSTIENAVEYMLKHHIYKRSRNLQKVSKPGWLRLGFPLMYNSDILEISYLLAKEGYRDERMQDAVDIIVSKQNDKGRWILHNTFNGRFQVNIETKNKPSKWLTLNALRMLKLLYG
jgi:hypothetical protein